MVWIFAGLAACIFLGLAVSHAQEMLVDLNQPEDWIPVHDVSRIEARENTLSFQAKDADPYVISRLVEISTQRYQAMVIEMSLNAGSVAQVFWSNHADGHFRETSSHRFYPKADGKFHRYVLSLADHPEWMGEIRRLRFDPTNQQAEIHIRSFKIIERIGPEIEKVRWKAAAPFVKPGETLQLTGAFRNVGDSIGSVDCQLELRDLSGRVIQSTTQSLQIEPSQEQDIHWKIEMEDDFIGEAICEWQGNEASEIIPAARGEMRTLVQVWNYEEAQEAVSLRAQNWRALFPKTPFGFGAIRIQFGEDSEHDFAWMARLATVDIELEDGTIQSFPVFADSVATRHDTGLIFDREWTDRDGREWRFHLEIDRYLKPREGLRMRYSLQGDGGKLLRLLGPEIFVGEKSFGQKKDFALFPGVEFLDAEAVSSSETIARPPVRDQYVPHPYKVTVPVMSFSHEDRMVALLWPPLSYWSREEFAYSPIFSVPNRYYGQENHLMGLMIPTIPRYAAENQERAHTPFTMQTGVPVLLNCFIYLAEEQDPMEAVDAWVEVYNGGTLPEPLPAPRSYEEQVALSREAYLTTCWDEEAKGWGHCAGWSAHPSGGMLALLELDKRLAADPEVKKTLQERIDLVYRELVEKHGKAALGIAAGCHVMVFESALFWGVTEHIMPDWMKVAQRLIQIQNADGSWGFRPRNEQQRTLGQEGEVVSGTIAPDAMYLLRLGRISADAKVTHAGLKALHALNARRVPRGSQGWECPIAAPDVLVSAYGTRANLDAYLITGDEKYMREAVYWARTGLAFHYLWSLPDRPLQKYATIPIFGTTFFTHTWIGVPVQWCGLVYANHLLELAEVNDEYPWENIARGIVNSGMYQQLTEGKYIGTLPDSYGDYFITPHGAYINPENIMTNLHHLEGNSLGIRTIFAEPSAIEALRISANADLKIIHSNEKSLSFSLHLMQGRVSETIIAPVLHAPQRVRVGEYDLEKRDDLFEIAQGWSYDANLRALFLHVEHGEKAVGVEVQF